MNRLKLLTTLLVLILLIAACGEEDPTPTSGPAHRSAN